MNLAESEASITLDGIASQIVECNTALDTFFTGTVKRCGYCLAACIISKLRSLVQL